MPGWDYVERLTAKPDTTAQDTEPHPAPEIARPVRLVEIDVPLGDLIVLTFKLFIAGVPLGMVLAGLWYLVTRVP